LIKVELYDRINLQGVRTMGRNKIENPIKQKISFSCSSRYKERVLLLTDVMGKRTFSEAMREIVGEGVLLLESKYFGKEGSQQLMPFECADYPRFTHREDG